MRSPTAAFLTCLFLVAIAAAPAPASDHDHPAAADHADGPKLENLLRAELAGFDGGEVIVSRVTIPPHTTLPRHWHPGEEFAYVLEGSCYLWQADEEDIPAHAGDVLAVPLRQVHTAYTRDESATILVFRVHEEGQPERVPVD